MGGFRRTKTGDALSKRKRILIGLALFAGTYIWFFGVQTSVALLARYKCRGVPEAWETPVPLADVSASNAPHTRIACTAYELELPWDDVNPEKSKNVGTICLTAFHSGNSFWFSSFPRGEFVNGLLREGFDRESFRRTYGDDALQSDYHFMRTMLQITPASIRPFGSRQDAGVGMATIMIKAISVPKAETGIFTVRTPEGQGFQYENPHGRPFKIVDDVYGDDGGFEFIFLQKAGGPTADITQPEINRVLQSVHKVRKDVSDAKPRQ